MTLLAFGGSLGNLLPGDLGRGTHHQLPHPGDHHHHGEHSHNHNNEHHHHDEQSQEHHQGSPNHGHHQRDNEHHDQDEERRGRQDGEGFVGQLIDFSSAVDDPSTGLKCVLEEATVDTFEKERLLTCTHSMIQVLDHFLPNLHLFLSCTGLPLHLRDPVPSPPGGGVQRVLREDLLHRLLREGHQRDGEKVLQAGREGLQRRRSRDLSDRL